MPPAISGFLPLEHTKLEMKLATPVFFFQKKEEILVCVLFGRNNVQ